MHVLLFYNCVLTVVKYTDMLCYVMLCCCCCWPLCMLLTCNVDDVNLVVTAIFKPIRTTNRLATFFHLSFSVLAVAITAVARVLGASNIICVMLDNPVGPHGSVRVVVLQCTANIQRRQL